jgi:hypothetical protein
MGKLFGIVVIVLAMWVGLEIYTQGVRGAFGGLLAGLDSSDEQTETADGGAPLENLRNKVNRDNDEGWARRERMMGDDER